MCVRTRADQRHVALENVDELRQLVEARPAQEAPHPRHPAVVAPGQHLGIGVGQVVMHGPELPAIEQIVVEAVALLPEKHRPARSEEHTSELQSLMRISYAVFCLKKK